MQFNPIVAASLSNQGLLSEEICDSHSLLIDRRFWINLVDDFLAFNAHCLEVFPEIFVVVGDHPLLIGVV